MRAGVAGFSPVCENVPTTPGQSPWGTSRLPVCVCVGVSWVLGSSARLGSRLADPPVGRVSACLAWQVACGLGWPIWVGGEFPLGSSHRGGWGVRGNNFSKRPSLNFLLMPLLRAEGHKRSRLTLA